MEKRVTTFRTRVKAFVCFTAILFCLCSFFSCGKDSLAIPDVRVDYRISVQEFNIRNKNGILLVNGHGVAGLILTNNSGVFQAFDRCSTVDPEKRCPVMPEESGLTAVDTCSGGIFSLYDGTPQKAPAKKSLRQYSVVVTQGSLIQVTN